MILKNLLPASRDMRPFNTMPIQNSVKRLMLSDSATSRPYCTIVQLKETIDNDMARPSCQFQSNDLGITGYCAILTDKEEATGDTIILFSSAPVNC